MPVCPHPKCPCAHKNVPAEDLINHVQSSPWAALYFCGICRCVCKSETVLIHHKQKIHKTSFAAVPSQPTRASSANCPCRICDRAYSTANALEQHYRDTPVHPKCTRCNVGFLDNTAKQAHVASVHRPITCNACNGLQVYREDVSHHYKISPRHPSCAVCDIGFENGEAFDEHNITKHPQFTCRICNLSFGSAALLDVHYQESSRHPRCPECLLSFEDNLALIKHVIAIFNPLIKDSGKLILKTSQMSLHDAFSDASIISHVSRSSSVVRSLRDPSTGALSPTRSIASSVPVPQRQVSTPPTNLSPAAASDRGIPTGDGIPLAPHYSSASSISSPSLISRVASMSDEVVDLGVPEERAEPMHNLALTLPNVTTSLQHSPALSAAGSLSTRSVVAVSETGSPVSSAQSIFGRALSITSIPGKQVAATVPSSGVTLTSSVISSAKESIVGTTRSRASSVQSFDSVPRTTGPGRSPGAVSPSSSVRTVSPPPSHAVFPTTSQRGRFKIVSVNNTSRANSLPKSHDSERFHSPEPVNARTTTSTFATSTSPRLPSPTESMTKTGPRLAERSLPLFTPGPTIGVSYPSAQPQTDLAACDRLVSYVYCRVCRRDPCRQPAATMCGHVFCYQCISSEVVKTSRCPVCEVPTLLYSIFRLHLV
ncbi:hypothetical protein BJV78DRAFT_258234 [Lactifluus subvellereus]|nr:hypothetical protein BJV78DRAFT_258234 [Lactifluus subvellereus]